MSCGIVADRSEIGMTEVKICDHEDLKKVRNLPLKQVQTMTVPQWSWRKSPITKQVAVICTRLNLYAIFPAVKKYGFQRGSERTICPGKWPNRTVREGRDMLCFQFRYTPLPSRQTGPIYLSKSMMVAVPTHPRAVIKADIQFQQKEDAARKGCILLSIIWIYTCPFPAGS
jgi:hypothetical protein